MIFSTGCSQLPMAAIVLLIFKALCKLPESPLHCMFLSTEIHLPMQETWV